MKSEMQQEHPSRESSDTVPIDAIEKELGIKIVRLGQGADKCRFMLRYGTRELEVEIFKHNAVDVATACIDTYDFNDSHDIEGQTTTLLEAFRRIVQETSNLRKKSCWLTLATGYSSLRQWCDDPEKGRRIFPRWDREETTRDGRVVKKFLLIQPEL